MASDPSPTGSMLAAERAEHHARVAFRAHNRRWRPFAKAFAAVAAFLFVFAWLLAIFDTNPAARAPETVVAPP